MAKLTLTDLTDLSGNPGGSMTAINANNAAIEAALENTLSRDGSSPNSLSSTLDMNSFRIINLPYATSGNEPVTLAQLTAMGVDTGQNTAYAAAVHSHVTSDITDYVATTNILINNAVGAISASGVSNGDKGDITVSGGGVVWTIDSGVVTTSKLGGDITAAGKALLDDADAPSQRNTLGLGTAATLASTYFAIASHTHSGADVTSGSLPDARLSANVPLYNAATANFTGDLQIGGFSVATKIVPQNSQSGNYTCVLGDSGKHIYHPVAAGAGHTYTIPANASVAYPIGTAITFVNLDATNSLSIAITTDTMYLSATGTTGTRTLGTYGVATALKVTSTAWIISGSDLT